MTKVQKRALSLFLVFCMTFAMMPQIPGFAAKYAKAAIQGIAEVIIPEKTLGITSGGTGEISGYATFSNASASNAWASASDADRKAACKATWSNAQTIESVSFSEVNDNGTFKATVTAKEVTEESTDSIVISIGGVPGEAVTITVSPEADETIKVSGITVTPKDSVSTVKEGQTLQMLAEVRPDTATNKNVTWESLTPEVATVDANGLVTAGEVSEDTKVTIKAIAKDGSDISGTYEITVLNVVAPEEKNPVTDIKLSDGSLILATGESETLTYKTLPENPDPFEVEWSSSNEEIVTVNDKGVLTANKTKLGLATITVTVKGTDIKDTCKVQVTKPRLNFGINQVYVLVGESKALNLVGHAMPEEEWKTEYTISDNSIIEKVESDDRYFEFKAKKAGVAMVTARVGDLTATATITVTTDPENPGVVLDKAAEELENILMDSGATPAEKKEAVKKAAASVKKIIDAQMPNVNDFSKFEDYMIDSIERMEDILFAMGIYDTDTDTGNVAELGVSDVSFKGAVFAMAGIENAATATLEMKKATVPADFNGNKTGAVAIDIDLLVKDASGNRLTGGKLSVPVIISMEVPADLLEVNNLIIYHYTSNGVEKIKPVVEDGYLTFAVTSFSNFVFAKAPESNNNSGGSGGSSGGSVSDGSLSGQWVQDDAGWWFKKTSGGFVSNQWAKISGKQYCFNAEGYMITGWYLENGIWYYLQPQGDMAEKTWVSVNGAWYYLHENGVMLSNQWFLSNGTWYYLTTDGSMAVNTTTPDGCQVNEVGAWIQ